MVWYSVTSVDIRQLDILGEWCKYSTEKFFLFLYWVAYISMGSYSALKYEWFKHSLWINLQVINLISYSTNIVLSFRNHITIISYFILLYNLNL